MEENTNTSCSLNGSSRIDIFKAVGVDKDTNKVDKHVLKAVSDQDYDAFIGFCDKVAAEFDRIKSVSCKIGRTRAKFDIEYK